MKAQLLLLYVAHESSVGVRERERERPSGRMELIETDNSELNDDNHHQLGCAKDDLPELILIFLCTREIRYNKFDSAQESTAVSVLLTARRRMLSLCALVVSARIYMAFLLPRVLSLAMYSSPVPPSRAVQEQSIE